MKLQKSTAIAVLFVILAVFCLFVACDNGTTTEYTVTFNLNGGSGTVPSAQTLNDDSSVTLPNGSGLSKTGYTFGGWNTKADGTGINYSGGSSFTPAGSVTLYAKWNVATYTVTYNINGGSGTVPSARIVNHGSNIEIPNGDGMSHMYAVFDGWITDYVGEKFSAGESITVYDTITLYAKWILDGTTSYTVTFDTNGGSEGGMYGSNPRTVSPGSSIYMYLPIIYGPFHNGYTFGGWNTEPDGTGTNYFTDSLYGGETNYFTDSSYTVTGNITLYAKWIAAGTANYTVTFNANGGSGTVPSTQTVSSGSIMLPSGSGLSRSGYTFGGWNTNASGTGTNYAAGSSFTPSGNITLYAKWNAGQVGTYTVTFNANGGGGTAPSAQTVQTGSSITLPNRGSLYMASATFIGWNTEADGTGTNYTAGSSFTPTGTITLYAEWGYTITFNINEGSGTVPEAQTVQVGSSTTLPSGNGLSGNFCTFGGWNTNPDGTGADYSAGSSFTPTGTITLYAKWNITTPFESVTGLANKLEWLRAHAQSNTSYTIVVNADESISSRSLYYSNRNNITITLRSVDANRTVSLSSNGAMFTVNSGVTLVLDNNITLQGHNSNNDRLVVVFGGTLRMNNGSVITGNTGGGVYVDYNGTFTMNGGTISGNTSGGGGGVNVSAYGTFTMNGGTISGNTATGNGGGVFVSGTFNMRGGTISGNTVASRGTSIGGGGGVYVSVNLTEGYGTFNKSYGNIYGYSENDTVNSNVVKDTSGTIWWEGRGHAVLAVGREWGSTIYIKSRDKTAGLGVDLSCNGRTLSGGWDN